MQEHPPTIESAEQHLTTGSHQQQVYSLLQEHLHDTNMDTKFATLCCALAANEDFTKLVLLIKCNSDTNGCVSTSKTLSELVRIVACPKIGAILSAAEYYACLKPKANSNYITTREQQAVIECTLLPQDRIVVNAFAGAGKTSMLVQLAQHHSEKKILYVCFGRDAMTDAKTKFPSHVTCSTWHAVALSHLKKQGYNFTIGWNEIWAVQETLKNFFQSDAREPSKQHLPKLNSTQLEQSVLSKSKNAWIAMTSKSLSFPTHDAYLKAFQLQLPVLPYDIIIVDEAQDTNPCTLAIIKQVAQPVVLVGDSHQCIFGFRGALDALSAINATARFTLSLSHRFGSTIASLATSILRSYKQEPISVLGNMAKSQISSYDNVTTVNVTKYTYVARTNAALFTHAMKLASDNIPVAFYGGYPMHIDTWIRDMYYLFMEMPEKIQTPFIKKLTSFEQLKDKYYNKNDIDEYVSAFSVVMRHKEDTLTLLNCIDPNESNPQVLVSTVQKAKGAEWDVVVLANDFSFFTCSTSNHQDKEQEVNMLYTAVTRARCHVVLPIELRNVIEKENLRVPMAHAQMENSCVYCKQNRHTHEQQQQQQQAQQPPLKRIAETTLVNPRAAKKQKTQ